MKNLILLLFVIMPLIVHSQSECRGMGASRIFQVNNIGASFSPQGGKFFNENGFFRAPYTSGNSVFTMFASDPWIAGFVNGELKLAAQQFSGYSNFDYYTGPLLEGAETLGDDCYLFNHIWQVTREEILKHRTDFESDGIIDDTVYSVFGWPAQGNDYFLNVNGFALPDLHHGQWAEFNDVNNNGIYEPGLGEYPCVRLKGKQFDPEEIMWMVFNDQGVHEFSEGDPLGLEIQLTVFAFNCEDNPVINNALFNTYKVINQSDLSIDSLFFSMWTDYDLGCAGDDYYGCDTLRNTEFAYNKDSIDGDFGSLCTTGSDTYGAYPPIQSLTYLSQQMNSYTQSFHMENQTGSGYTPEERINLMKGKWYDGTPITAFETGYNPGSSYTETKFLFHGDPRDSEQWSQNAFKPIQSSPLTVSSLHFERLDSYDSIVVETVYMFHQDSSLDHIQQVGFMQYQIDSLLTLLSQSELNCVRPVDCVDGDSSCVWPGDFNHDGIADHYDPLYWGAGKNSLGSRRDGRMNWNGYVSDNWAAELPEGTNVKHCDGNGDGIVDDEDMDRNVQHFLNTNPFYSPNDVYPEGPEVKIRSDAMEADGSIPKIWVSAGIDIENVLGLAYELEFDTLMYEVEFPHFRECPDVENGFCLFSEVYLPSNIDMTSTTRYSFVRSDKQEMTIEKGFWFEYYIKGLKLKEGVSFSEIPDTVVLRLKNLIALDANGNDLGIGAFPLKIPKHVIVGQNDPVYSPVTIFPNPVNDILYIQSDVPTAIRLYSIDGQLLRHREVAADNDFMDISAFPPGLYILRIMSTGETIKVIRQ